MFDHLSVDITPLAFIHAAAVLISHTQHVDEEDNL